MIQDVPPRYFHRNVIQQMPKVGLNIREVIYELVVQDKIDLALQVAESANDSFTQSIWKMTVAFKAMEVGDFDTPRPIWEQVITDNGIEELD